MCEGASAISDTVAAASQQSTHLKGETPHDELNRLISMHLFLAMLAAPLSSHRQLASQHKDHPLRQLLSHRQLMSQAQCDAAYSSMIAAAATSDSACKQAAGMMPSMAAQIIPPDCDPDMSVFSTVNNCNELKAAWDALCVEATSKRPWFDNL